MKTITFTIAILFLTGLFFHANAWNHLNSGTNQRLNSIQFLNDSTGFAVGDGGVIVKTTNAGFSWSVINSGTTNALNKIFFINSNIGFAVGTSGTILKTMDGGQSWAIQTSGTTKILKSVYFTDINNGYVVGMQGAILKTTNGGTDWNLLYSGTALHGQSVYFINNQFGYITTYSGRIIRTTDGGITWDVDTLTNTNLNSVVFINSTTGFIAGSSGKIFKTTDGGYTWSLTQISTQALYSVYFVDNNLGYAAGDGLVKTTDGGITWNQMPDVISSLSIFFTNPTVGYSVGGTQGEILKTYIGGSYASSDYLDRSNIKARFNLGKSAFWDLVGNARFEVPKGSGKMSLFAGALIIGGKDNNGEIHLLGDRYSSTGQDLFPGPIMNPSDYMQEEERWNRIWRVTRDEVDYHLSHWGSPGYIMPASFYQWPANGNVSAGQLPVIAPYYDANGDGFYNPSSGDYPLIKGDEAIFFVVNDSMRTHTETNGKSIGVEIRIMAYAFDCGGDSSLWNTLFVNYEIINRSQNTYDSTFIGTFMDTDIGDASDDYIGCDVERGTFYGYNGDANDGDGLGVTYGTHPPAQSITFLGGPFMDADGSDYGFTGVADGCDESINGLGFNDGIIDNERLGMSSFMYFNNSGGLMGDPISPQEYYYYLTGRWKDGSFMRYGGNGHLSDSLYCKFMFPDITDSCGWGTEGIPRPAWSETTENNSPDDRRGIASLGPFTFLSESVHNVEIAFVFGRDFTNPDPWAGVVNMQQRIDTIRQYFITNSTPCGSFNSAVKENKLNTESFVVFPNPANSFFDVKTENNSANNILKIYSIEGALVKETSFTGNQTRIFTDKLSNGLYVVEIKSNNNVQYKKVIISK